MRKTSIRGTVGLFASCAILGFCHSAMAAEAEMLTALRDGLPITTEITNTTKRRMSVGPRQLRYALPLKVGDKVHISVDGASAILPRIVLVDMKYSENPLAYGGGQAKRELVYRVDRNGDFNLIVLSDKPTGPFTIAMKTVEFSSGTPAAAPLLHARSRMTTNTLTWQFKGRSGRLIDAHFNSCGVPVKMTIYRQGLLSVPVVDSATGVDPHVVVAIVQEGTYFLEVVASPSAEGVPYSATLSEDGPLAETSRYAPPCNTSSGRLTNSEVTRRWGAAARLADHPWRVTDPKGPWVANFEWADKGRVLILKKRGVGEFDAETRYVIGYNEFTGAFEFVEPTGALTTQSQPLSSSFFASLSPFPFAQEQAQLRAREEARLSAERQADVQRSSDGRGGLMGALMGAAGGLAAGAAAGGNTKQMIEQAGKGAAMFSDSPVAKAFALATGAASPRQAVSSSNLGAATGGAYPTRPNLAATNACSGFTEQNYRTKAFEGGGDAQLYTMCGQAFEYYTMYKRAIAQGYSEADANRTYAAHEQAARNANSFYQNNRAN